MMFTSVVVTLLLALIFADVSTTLTPDSRGYIVYCPCMGRFGNQADQFLGALAFARSLDRTLVLPHWIEYPQTALGTSVQIPFDRYFQVEPLLQYHRVILMQQFMDELAPQIWPAGNRTIFCYRARDAGDPTAPSSCNPKHGNPFGPFWDAFDIDFTGDEYYGPMLWGDRDTAAWRERYPATNWPVLTFTGAPGAFPVTQANAKLHKYLLWSDTIADTAQSVIDRHIKRPYIGVHLRIGSDWSNACRHVSDSRDHHLFASQQCLGMRFEHGKLTEEICLPKVETVVRQIMTLVHRYKANSVFLARDSPQYDDAITAALSKIYVLYYWLPESNPHLDLAILAKSDHYIGNCVSTFSAFATRERRANGHDVSFWAFTSRSTDEL